MTHLTLPYMPLVSRPHQRRGTVSNALVGAEFEQVAMQYFQRNGIVLTRNYALEIGFDVKKLHRFDLGSMCPGIIVECKSHRWTEGAKVPSAKLTVWNEAMLYFHLAPSGYRKILFVLHDKRGGTGETLLSYYRRTYSHLIPCGVEFIEFDELSKSIIVS